MVPGPPSPSRMAMLFIACGRAWGMTSAASTKRALNSLWWDHSRSL